MMKNCKRKILSRVLSVGTVAILAASIVPSFAATQHKYPYFCQPLAALSGETDEVGGTHHSSGTLSIWLWSMQKNNGSVTTNHIYHGYFWATDTTNARNHVSGVTLLPALTPIDNSHTSTTITYDRNRISNNMSVMLRGRCREVCLDSVQTSGEVNFG